MRIVRLVPPSQPVAMTTVRVTSPPPSIPTRKWGLLVGETTIGRCFKNSSTTEFPAKTWTPQRQYCSGGSHGRHLDMEVFDVRTLTFESFEFAGNLIELDNEPQRFIERWIFNLPKMRFCAFQERGGHLEWCAPCAVGKFRSHPLAT